MKLLFVHDHRFKKHGNDFYSNGSFPSSIWPRYTSVFNSLTVVGRNGGSLIEESNGFTLSSADQVQFELFPNTSNLKNLIFGDREVTLATVRLVEKHDAVLVRLPSRLGILFIKEAIKQRKPYAIEVVGCPWDALWHYGTLKGKLFAPYAAIELKAVLKKAGFVLYVTRFFLQKRYQAAEGAVTTFCSNVEVPPVSEHVLVNKLEKINYRAVDDIVCFGLIGNYSSKYKGIDVAIRALAKADLPNWRLNVLGNGDASIYIALAESLGVADNVGFVGSLPAGDPVFAWLDSVDIYLHPSLTEGMPRALIEAMSRGCPALASDIGGIPELLNVEEMFKVSDVDSLAEKVQRLVNDQEKQKTLAKNNFKIAKNYYKNVLDARRAEFWHTFKKRIENK